MATDERADDLAELLRQLAGEPGEEARADLASVRDTLRRGRQRRAEHAVKARMVELVEVLASIYREVVAQMPPADRLRDVMRREFKVHDVDHLCLTRDEIRERRGPVEAARERVGTFGIELVRANAQAGLFDDSEAVCELLSQESDTRHPNSLLAWAKKFKVVEVWGEVAGARAFEEFIAHAR